jgi:two-component system chemotaxis response regulator CheY
MSKRIVSVGQCGPDHATISSFLRSMFDCEVVSTDGLVDTIRELKSAPVHLVLINRKLDADYSDGIEILRAIKSDAEIAHAPVMLVTNYPEHQDAAVEAGALRGFGKLEFEHAESKKKLAAVLAI